MPIHKMNFDSGVFHAVKVGYTDNVDARMWANALKKHAQSSDFPIVALVDMTGVDRLCQTVVKIYEKISQHPNVLSISIVISDVVVSRNSKIIDKLNSLPNVRLFTDMNVAINFCEENLHPSIGAGTACMMIATPRFAVAVL